MTTQQLWFIFYVLACSSKTLEFNSCQSIGMTISMSLLTENLFLDSLKMQILHGIVALLAWVWAGCVSGWIRNPVLGRLLQVFCSTENPVSFPFALHLFPYSGVGDNKVFAFSFRVFRKGNTHSSTNATTHMLWENDYSSWSILEVLGFCYSF